MFNRTDNTKLQPQDLKPDFIAKLLTLFSHSSQRGSSLPVAMGLGVVMVGLTTMAVINSGRNKTEVTADNMKKEVVAVAEGAVARFQNLLAQNPGLAVLNSQQWQIIANATTDAQVQNELSPIIGTSGGTNTCPGSASEPGDPSGSGTTLLSRTTVQPLLRAGGVVDVSNLTNGTSNWMSFSGDKQYRLISYRYNGPTAQSGTLKLQSRSTTNGAISQLSVDIPVRAVPGSSTVSATGTGVPALWITDNINNDFGNNNFRGTIKVSSPTCTFVGAMPVPGRTASENNGLITVVKSKEAMPPTPNLPTTYYTISTIDGGETLPRSGDRADATTGYVHYLVPAVDLGGNSNFTVSPNSKVVIHLQGNFSMSGNSTITVPSSSQLEIYGNTFVPGIGSKYQTGCISATARGCQTNTVIINGSGTTAKLFIHAPAATGGVSGGGNSDPNFSGSLWLKAWNGSSSNSGVLLGGSGSYGDYLAGKNRTVPGDPTITLAPVTKWSIEQASN